MLPSCKATQANVNKEDVFQLKPFLLEKTLVCLAVFQDLSSGEFFAELKALSSLSRAGSRNRTLEWNIA